jgi:sugar/nucleoside kinase (ribokinase family)
MLVQLGNDEVGHSYLKNFKENNVHTEHAKILEGVGSGQAYILSLPNGNNAIVIVGGSNEEYDPAMTELDPKWAETISKCK